MDRAAYAEDSSYSWTVYGEKEDVAAVTLADIKEFYNNHYHPANAVLVIGGDVTPDEGFAKAEEAFGQIAQHASTDRITHTVDQLRKGEHVVVPDNVPIPAVFLAFHVPSMLSVEMFAVDLASTILSAGKRATLYRDLVVDQQVASAAGTFIDRRANSSLLIHYAYAARPGVETDQLAEALLTSVARTKVSPTDRERVVNRMRTAFAAEHQRVGSRADSLAWAATFLGDSQEVNNTMNKYSSRTLDQIQNILAIASDAEKIVRVDVVPA
jgi:zinc protease